MLIVIRLLSPIVVRQHFQCGIQVNFVMLKIDRDRHYARWKKAVQRTMKWEVNDDENQGIKQCCY